MAAPRRRSMRRPKGEPCSGCGSLVCQCLELALLQQIRFHGLPEPIQQYPFASPRKFRADFAWPEQRVIVEVEGGGQYGHHATRDGYRSDCIKYNAAVLLGWKVLRFTGEMIEDGYEGILPAETIKYALENRP